MDGDWSVLDIEPTREKQLEELVADYDELVSSMDGYGMKKAAIIAELQERMDELEVKVTSGGEKLG